MRYIISFLFFTLMCSTISAQVETNSSAKDFEFGAIGGFSLSDVVKLDENEDSGLRLGIHLGGYAQFDIQNKFGFRPELHIISVKGTSRGDFKTYYFDLPLMGTYDLDDKFKVMAGFQPSILINATVGDGRGNITNDIRTFNFGVIAGLWYKIDNQWGVGIRASRDLSRVGAGGESGRDFNVNYQFSVGYRIM